MKRDENGLVVSKGDFDYTLQVDTPNRGVVSAFCHMIMDFRERRYEVSTDEQLRCLRISVFETLVNGLISAGYVRLKEDIKKFFGLDSVSITISTERELSRFQLANLKVFQDDLCEEWDTFSVKKYMKYLRDLLEAMCKQGLVAVNTVEVPTSCLEQLESLAGSDVQTHAADLISCVLCNCCANVLESTTRDFVLLVMAMSNDDTTRALDNNQVNLQTYIEEIIEPEYRDKVDWYVKRFLD